MAVATEPYVSPEGYLAAERQAETKSEYINGQVYAMPGASRAHNTILPNTLNVIADQIRNRGYETYSGMRLRLVAPRAYVCPDIAVVYGEPQVEDDHKDTMLNPVVLIEVLTSSMDSHDRGIKFYHYRHLETIQELVAIAPDRVHVEHYIRKEDGQWLLRDVDDSDAVLWLESIGCDLPLDEVYSQVRFKAEEGADGRTG